MKTQYKLLIAVAFFVTPMLTAWAFSPNEREQKMIDSGTLKGEMAQEHIDTDALRKAKADYDASMDKQIADKQADYADKASKKAAIDAELDKEDGAFQTNQ